MDAIYRWEECMRKNIGTKLKRLRYARFDMALTIYEVCNKLDVPMQRTELSRIEKGIGGAGEKKLMSLLKFYNVSFDWLLNGDIDDLHRGVWIPPFEHNPESLAKSISEKVSKLIDSEDYIAVDDACTFVYGQLRFDEAKLNFIKSNNTKNRRLISLIRFCQYYNVSMQWLLHGDISDIDAGTVPEFEPPKVLKCNAC